MRYRVEYNNGHGQPQTTFINADGYSAYGRDATFYRRTGMVNHNPWGDGSMSTMPGDVIHSSTVNVASINNWEMIIEDNTFEMTQPADESDDL